MSYILLIECISIVLLLLLGSTIKIKLFSYDLVNFISIFTLSLALLIVVLFAILTINDKSDEIQEIENIQMGISNLDSVEQSVIISRYNSDIYNAKQSVDTYGRWSLNYGTKIIKCKPIKK